MFKTLKNFRVKFVWIRPISATRWDALIIALSFILSRIIESLRVAFPAACGEHEEWTPEYPAACGGDHLFAVEAAVPAGKLVHAILDNYAAHKHPKVMAWPERHPRWTFHFTPHLVLVAERGRRLLRDPDQAPP